MPPVALSDQQRGPRATWLRRHRLAMYGSGDGGLERLSVALREEGLDRSPATIRGWESSDDRSPIPPDVLPVLERLFREPAPRPTSNSTTPELVSALHAQTEALAELVAEMRESRGHRVGEAPAPYGVDEATKRRRRRFWIERAMEERKLNAEEIGRRMDWPSSQLQKVRAWIRGELPTGASRARFAAALSLPLHVLEEPPPDDHERLVQWRREALAAVAPAELEEPARERRSA